MRRWQLSQHGVGEGVQRRKSLPLQGNLQLPFAAGSSSVASAWESKWEAGTC